MKIWLLSSLGLHLLGAAVVIGVTAAAPPAIVPPWVVVETMGVPTRAVSGKGTRASRSNLKVGEEVPTGVASPLVGEGNALPHYPEEAIRNSWEGKTELLLTIRPDGSVSDVDLLSSSGHETLDSAALDRAFSWRFAQYSGKRIRVPIQFALND